MLYNVRRLLCFGDDINEEVSVLLSRLNYSIAYIVSMSMHK